MFSGVRVVIWVGTPVGVHGIVRGGAIMRCHIGTVRFIVAIHIHLVLAHDFPTAGESNKNSNNFEGILYIKGILQSVRMKQIFKTNDCKRILLNCTFNINFKKWQPIFSN